MQAKVEGIIIAPEITKENAARDIKSEGILHFLVTERGQPLVKKIKCSIGKASEYIKAGAGISEGTIVEPTSLIIDVSEYNVNGRSGTSYRLVEA